MALTKSQWYDKVKTFVPDWWFETENHQVAVLQALAAVIAQVDQEADNHFNETFITRSSAPIIDGHGDERGVDRLPLENDGPYANRIRYIVNQSDPVDLALMVSALIVRGTVSIKEHETGDRPFLGRGTFCNRHDVFTDEFYNVFSIVVDKQIHAPYSFLGRHNFASRGDFMGTSTSLIGVLEQIVAAVNKAKAFGVMYRVTETND